MKTKLLLMFLSVFVMLGLHAQAQDRQHFR